MTMQFGNCCAGCNQGALVDFYANTTKVRPAGDSMGPNYTATPYPRMSIATYGDPGDTCAAGISPVGTCGLWLAGGDLVGLSAQEINNCVNDIMTCAGGPTVQVNDHNCYTKQSTQVDTRVKKPFGGAWIAARKFHHGTLGFIDRDDPHLITGITFNTTNGAFSYTYSDDGGAYPQPPQTHYLECSFNLSGSSNRPNGSGNGTMSSTGAASIARYSGVQTWDAGTFSSTADDIGTTEAGILLGQLMQDWNTWVGHFTAGWTVPVGSGGFYAANPSAGVYQVLNDLPSPGTVYEEYDLSISAGAFTASHTVFNPYNDGGVSTPFLVETITLNNTSCHYQWTQFNSSDDPTNNQTLVEEGYSTLSNPYAASDCGADWLNMLNFWDMSDYTLQNLRTDGELANPPLIIYDEKGASTPTPQITPTMDDLSQPQNGDGSWPQRTLLDDYMWVYPGGCLTQPSGFTGGATLVYPLHSGLLISRNPPGYDRHFWFGFQEQERDFVSDSSDYEWFPNSAGAFSPSPLPNCTLRWLSKEEAQYDPLAFRNGITVAPPGNYPQWWWNQTTGRLIGGKYCQVTQPWPGTDFGRPCSADRFVVDQTTVCCVNSGNAGSGFVVSNTINALAPLAAGGLQVNDYIVNNGDGIYQITGISGSGPWTITVGAQLDTLPTGYIFSRGTNDAGYLGRLRFPTAPAICGRAPITCTLAGGTLTITANPSLPYLRKGANAGISVDLYDTNMTLLASAVALTRVSDSEFTCTSSAASAVYMVSAGVDWTKSSAASRKTGVYFHWEFSIRPVAYPSPPTWYAGAGGCIGCTVTQFNFSAGKCPAVVALSDNGENFGNQVKYSPAGEAVGGGFTFDDVYGGHGQAAVMLTMQDPFEQTPFKPYCANSGGNNFAWVEDDGTGEVDTFNSDDDPVAKYFPHHTLVEAMSTVPAGSSLPPGISLAYDPVQNEIAPPFFIAGGTGLSGGIGIGDDTGAFATLLTEWVFTLNVCDNSGNRFSSFYNYVNCGVTP